MKKTWLNTDGTFKGLNAEEISKLSDEEALEFGKDLGTHKEAKEKELDEKIEAKADAKELEALKKIVDELKKADYEAIKSQLKTQGKAMAALVEQVETQTAKQGQSFTAVVLKELAERKDELKDLMAKGAGTIKLEIKASQGAGDIDTGTDFATMESGVGQIATRQPLMKSLFTVQPISTEYLKYNDQDTIVRDAKNVAACAATVHNSKITWKVRTLQITKVRDFVDVCIDMMEDYSFVEGEIRNLVNTDVALKVDSQLLLGDDIYPNTNSVDAVASTHVAGDYALSIQAPTLIDLLKIAGAQISDFGQNNKFMANVILLNPVDFCKMQLLKDQDNNYILPSWITADGINIGAMRIIANQLIPVNEAYVFDSTKGTIFQRKGVTVELAFENRENFEKELVTVKAYERLNFRVRNVDANAFMHIEDIDAAIIALIKP